MPRYLKNWRYKDIVAFLKQHFFILNYTERSSHYYYKGFVDNEYREVEVQYHASKSISPKCLQHDIILKSGIPKEYWKDWARAGNKKAQREIQYEGAKKIK